jgi:hypothetical protein
MRNKGDGRPDVQVKTDILNEILLHHPKESIYRIYDDRFLVCEMWKQQGMPIQPVYKGELLTEQFIIHKLDCKEFGTGIKGRCKSCGAIEDF